MLDLKTAAQAHNGDISPINNDLQFGYAAEISKVNTIEFLEHSKHVVGIIGILVIILLPIPSN